MRCLEKGFIPEHIYPRPLQGVFLSFPPTLASWSLKRHPLPHNSIMSLTLGNILYSPHLPSCVSYVIYFIHSFITNISGGRTLSQPLGVQGDLHPDGARVKDTSTLQSEGGTGTEREPQQPSWRRCFSKALLDCKEASPGCCL